MQVATARESVLGDARERPAARRDAAQLDAHAARADRRAGGRLGAAARADRACGRRTGRVGGGDRPAGGRAVAAAVDPARRAPGRRRLPRRRRQPDRRAGSPARARRGAGGRRPRRHRRLPRHAALADRDGALLRCGPAPQARRAAGRDPGGPGAAVARPRRAGVGPDRRARRRRHPPEHRHHRRQAPLLDRRRQLLRRHRGGREGARVGRDRRRLLPRAGDVAPRRRGAGHAAGAAARARDRARVRDPGAADLRASAGGCCCGSRSAPTGCSRSTRCCRSALRSRCSR